MKVIQKYYQVIAAVTLMEKWSGFLFTHETDSSKYDLKEM